MAHQSKFLSVNLNKSYGEPSALSAGTGNGRPHSAGGGGGMVVLSRTRSSSGSMAHRKAPRLAVPPPVNLPSLRKEHERHDPASSKPLVGHGGSGIGAGNGLSMGWTKPGSPLPGLRDKDGSASALASGNQRDVGGDSRLHGFMEKAVIFRGDDFPSLRTSSFAPSQRQRQTSDNSEGVAGKPVLHSMIDMRPQLRSSPPIKDNVHISERGSNRVLDSLDHSRKDEENMSGPLPLFRLRHTSDWDDDERDRNNLFAGGDHHDGRLEQNGVAYSSLQRKSIVSDQFGREFMASSMKDGDISFWRTAVHVNKDSLTPHVSHNDRDQTVLRTSGLSRGTGTESSFDQLPHEDRRGFSSSIKIENSKTAKTSMGRSEVSKNRNGGKTFSNSMASEVQIPSGNKSTSSDAILNFGREKLISSAMKPYTEDENWECRDLLSGNHVLDLNSKAFRKKKEAMTKSDFYDPVRASFEAELERVQRIQEEERQRIMEEKVKAMELARRESEERERMALEEEERRRQVEEEAREAAWKAEQERLATARRAEEQRMAKEEEKRRFLVEEERRIEAARQKLLELNAKIAKREAEANLKHNRLKDGDISMVSDGSEWQETERIVEPIIISTSSNSSVMNRFSEIGSRSHFPRNNKYLSDRQGKPEIKWTSNNSNYHFQDQDGDYLPGRHDAFGSKKGFTRKEFHSSHGSTPFRPSFKRGNSDESDQRGQSLNSSGDSDQCNGRSDINALFRYNSRPCDIDMSHGGSYLERSYQNSEVDDIASFGRAHHSLRQPHVPPPFVSSSLRKNSFRAGFKSPSLLLPANIKADHDEIIVREEGMWMECDGYQQRTQKTGTADLLQVSAGSLVEKEEKSSLIYESQSPLSVSSPLSSPTQLLHDEFNEFGVSPALTASFEGEHATFSEGKNMMSVLEDGHMDAKLIVGSHGEDDEWTVEYSEVGEEQEIPDECHSSFQEDNEVHGDDAGVLTVVTKLQEMDLGGGKPTGESDQAGCGLDITIHPGASSYDELKKCSEDGELISAIQGSTVDSITEFDDHGIDSLQSDEAFHDKTVIASSEIADESDKALQELIIDSIESRALPIDSRDSNYSAEDPLVSVSSWLISSTSFASSMPTSVPTSSGQSEMPVKLQFGLFSGPPLIPSPIPAIQIGSIQMPLPLHSQFDNDSQMHPPHPPLFQFGHIRYTAPISQSFLSIYSQTISSPHSALVPESSKQSGGSPLNSVINSDYSSTKNLENRMSFVSADNQPRSAPEFINSPEIVDSKPINASLDVPKNDLVMSQSQMTKTGFDEERVLGKSKSLAVFNGATSSKNVRSMVNNKRSRGKPHAEQSSMSKKFASGLKAAGSICQIRGQRFDYDVNGSAFSSVKPVNPPAHLHQFDRRVRRHIRRTEYRVRENAGASQSQIKVTLNQERHGDKSTSADGLVGISLRDMGRKAPVLSDLMQPMNEGVTTCLQAISADSTLGKNIRTETMPKTIMHSVNVHGSEGCLKINMVLEEDDAPLQSGFIRIFNQPGIEASADADGFVEVKSKRKVLNDKRGQKEKETNSKNKDIKATRRHCDIPPSNVISKSDYTIAPKGGAASKGIHSNPAISSKKVSDNVGDLVLSTESMKSKTMPPIGTPAANSTDSNVKYSSLKSSYSNSVPAKTIDGSRLSPSLSFDKKIVGLKKNLVPFGTWGSVLLNQKDTSDPVTSISLEHGKHATSNMTHDNSSRSPANQLNFSLIGQKIQFGSVTSTAIVPSSSQATSNGVCPPGSVILNASNVLNLSQSNLVDQVNYPDVSCTYLDDNDVEAEAPASAVALSAIGNDEMAVSALDTCSTSTSEIKGFNASHVSVLTKGGASSIRDATNESSGEESLSVTLPADLSVDTALSSWPSLPSRQSSHPMISHIAGLQPSPFPLLDSNPMLGGPIFSFSPQDESTGTLAPQQQQSTTFGPGQTGPWPHRHSGIESFYGSPAGFPAPYINPAGGIASVPGHSQMVFYNPFDHVGQFGQVGLSYMGSTYIPSGKQPEWKHNTENSLMNVSNVESSTLNAISNQHNASNMPAPIQHLAPGSAVMPVASPFALLNIRPFQSSTDIAVPAHWRSIPHPHLSPHSVPLSMAPEFHHQDTRSSLFSQTPPFDVSNAKFGMLDIDNAAAKLPNEFNLMESTAPGSTSLKINHSSINPRIIDRNRGSIHSVAKDNSSPHRQVPPPHDSNPIEKSNHPSSTLKIGSGSEWRRRNVFQGRHGNLWTDKNAASSKMKQIYVAKSLSAGPDTSS